MNAPSCLRRLGTFLMIIEYLLAQISTDPIPTSANIRVLVEQAARYEFCAAALALVHSGIPHSHKPFWQMKSASDMHTLVRNMTATPSKVIALLDFDTANKLESRVSGY